MARKDTNAEIVAKRREAVSFLRLRGVSIRGMVERLPSPPFNILNPKSGKGYSASVIAEDLQALETEWQASAQANTGLRLGSLLAELEEVRRAAWMTPEPNLDLVLRTILAEAKLRGLAAPKKVEVSGPGGGECKPIQFVEVVRPGPSKEQIAAKVAELRRQQAERGHIDISALSDAELAATVEYSVDREAFANFMEDVKPYSEAIGQLARGELGDVEPDYATPAHHHREMTGPEAMAEEQSAEDAPPAGPAPTPPRPPAAMQPERPPPRPEPRAPASAMSHSAAWMRHL